MKFSTFSLFAVSSLFAGAFAAPAAQPEGSLINVDALNDVDVPVLSHEQKREEPCQQVKTVLVEVVTKVKQHTVVINQTVAALPSTTSISATEQTNLIAVVKKELYEIISIINTAINDITALNLTKVVGADLTEVVAVIVELVTEIVATLKPVIDLVGATVFGVVLPLLVHILAALLSTIENVLGGILALVKDLLTPILSIVGQVLIGLGDLLTDDCGCW